MNNARAAEAMGLTGMKLRPQRRDYEMDDDEVAMFDIGEEEEDEDEFDAEADNDNDLESGGRPGLQRQGSSSRGPSQGGSSPLSATL